MSKRKELEKKIDILERQRFLDVYNEFDRWLARMQYRSAKMDENSVTDNNILVHKIDNLYGIEHYVLDVLDMHLYFIRERNVHCFYFVHDFNFYSLPHHLDDFKAQILKDTLAKKNAMLELINEIPNN